MGPMSNWLYLTLTIPLYLVWITALSILFFHQVKIAYILFWSILGSLLSLLFSTIGEILFGIMFALYLAHSHRISDTFWVFLMMEYNLIIVNIGAIILEFGEHWHSSTILTVFISTRIIVILCSAILIYWAFFKRNDLIQKLYQSVNSSSTLQKAGLLYTGFICLSLYLIEFIFTIIKLSPATELFIFSIFLISIIISAFSLIFIIRVYKNQSEIKWLKESEKARQEYYNNLDVQQIHTRQIIHDYQNVLATIQLSLNNSGQHKDPVTKDLIAEAQKTLTQQQPDQGSLSAIACQPLRNLLSLKWTAAQNQGINLVIQTEGEQILAGISAVLPIIRIVGILLDNALEATIANQQKECITLISTDNQNNVEITIINQVAKQFRLAHLNQNGYTTKGKGHGQGMTIINDLISSHHNLHLRKHLNKTSLEISLYIEVNSHA